MPNEARATVNIRSQNVAIVEETVTSENEKKEKFNIIKSEETLNIELTNLNESVQISEVVLNDNIHEITLHKKPNEMEIQPEIIPNQSLLITESITSDNLQELPIHSQSENKAKINVLTHDANIVSETIVVQQENELIEPKAMLRMANQTILPFESGIEITEVEKAETEEELKFNLKTPLITPKYQLRSNESLQISEIYTEDKPDKYYPELIVATEIATKTILEQKPYITEEMIAPEKEDIYIVGKLPPQQIADVGIKESESLLISQINIEENEQNLIIDNELHNQKQYAIDKLTTLEGISINIADSQISTKEWDQPEINQKQATIEYTEQITVATGIIDISESEKNLESPEPVTTNSISFNISTLLTSEIMQPQLHEFESELLHDKKPNQFLATNLLEPSEAITIENIEILHSECTFENKKDYKSIEAVTNVELQDAITEITTILPHDKELEFLPKPLPEQIIAHQSFDMLASVEITNKELLEAEKSFDIGDNVQFQKAKLAPTHALKSIINEEIETLLTTDNVELLDISSDMAQVINSRLEEKTVQEIIPYESSKDFESPLKTIEYMATLTLDEKKSIEITTQEISEKENTFENKIDFDSHNATTVPTHLLKSILIEENEPMSNTDVMNFDKTIKTIAKILNDELTETTISETTPYENFINFEINEKPQKTTAQFTYDQTQTSIQVTSIDINEKEQNLETQNLIENHIAASKLSNDTMKSLLIEEIEPTMIVADTVETKQIQPTKAKISNGQFDEVIVDETIPYEGTRDLNQSERPTENIAVPALDIKISLQIHSTETSEKELSLEQTPSIDSHIAFVKPSHALKSIVTEQIETSMTTENIQDDKIQMHNVKIVSTELEETHVSETYQYEGIDDLKMNPGLEDSNAIPSINAYISIEVTSQETAEKENTFEIFDKYVDKYNAINVPSERLKAIVIEEIEPVIGTDDFIQKVAPSTKAKIINTELDETNIMEIIPCEGVTQFKTIKPDENFANKTYDVQKSIEITTQIISEKEKEFNSDNIFSSQIAYIKPTHSLKSVVIDENEPIMTTNYLKDEIVEKNKANIIDTEFTETTISETVPFENLADLKLVSKTEQKIAEQIFDEHSSLIIFTNESGESEQNLKITDLIDKHVANILPKDTLKSINVEEIKSMIIPTEFTASTKVKENAKIIIPNLYETDTSEIISYESIDNYIDQIKPEEKQAQQAIDKINEHITVTTQNSSEKEKDLQLPDINIQNENVSTISSHTLKTVITEETQIYNKTEDFQTVNNQTAIARTNTTDLQEKTISEIIPYENYNDNTVLNKPDQKFAKYYIDEQIPVIVTSNDLIDKEQEFLNTSEYNVEPFKIGSSHSLQSAITEANQIIDSTSELVQSEQRKYTAKENQNENEETTTTEIYPFESVEVQYDNLSNKINKMATESFDEQTPLIISSTQTVEQEEPFDVKQITIDQNIHPVPTYSLKSIVVEETYTNLSTNDLQHDDISYSKSKLITPDLQQTTISEVTLCENVTDHPIEKIECKEKFVKPNFDNEMNSLVVLEALIIENENLFERELIQRVNAISDVTKPQNIAIKTVTQHIDSTLPFQNIMETDRYADIRQTTVDALIIEETKTSENVNNYIENNIPECKTAIFEYDGLKVSEKTEIKPNDSISELSIQNTNKITAAYQSQLMESIHVHQPFSAIKEKDIIINKVPTQENATAIIQENRVAETTEISIHSSESPLNAHVPITHKATAILSEFKLPVQEETIPEEFLKELKDINTPEEKAKLNINESKVAEKLTTMIHETTTSFDEHVRNDRRASQTLDMLYATTVQETTSNETVDRLGIQTTKTEKHLKSKQHDSNNTIQVTEVETNESIRQFDVRLQEKQQITQLLETNKLIKAKSEKQVIVEGR